MRVAQLEHQVALSEQLVDLLLPDHLLLDQFNRHLGTGIQSRVHNPARAGAKGLAVSFFTAADAKHAAPLVRILKQAGQKAPKELKQMAKLMKGVPAASVAPAAAGGGGGGLYG